METDSIRILELENKYKDLIRNSFYMDKDYFEKNFTVFVFKNPLFKTIWIEILTREIYPIYLKILFSIKEIGIFNVGNFKGDVLIEGRLHLEEKKFKEVQ